MTSASMLSLEMQTPVPETNEFSWTPQDAKGQQLGSCKLNTEDPFNFAVPAFRIWSSHMVLSFLSVQAFVRRVRTRSYMGELCTRISLAAPSL